MSVLKSLRKVLGEISFEIKDFFRLREPEYQIMFSSYRHDYWVLNKEGDLVFRHKDKEECIRFIKMNTRGRHA